MQRGGLPTIHSHTYLKEIAINLWVWVILKLKVKLKITNNSTRGWKLRDYFAKRNFWLPICIRNGPAN